MRKLLDPDDKMSFFEHLEELRLRLLRSLIALAVGFFACLPFRYQLFELIARPIKLYLPDNDTLTYTRLPEPFFIYLKVSFLGGIFLAAPYILYQAWRFMAPGLYPDERRHTAPFVIGATLFFLLGGAFGYTQVFPTACRFFLGQGQFLKQMVTAQEYFSLCSRTILAVALVFEMPVVIAFMAKLHLVTHRFLLRNTKYAILVNFIVAALITPTQDMVTMTIVAVPMTVLYFISILVAWMFRSREKEVPEEESNGAASGGQSPAGRR